MPRRGGQDPRVIQPGDIGIWATCAMKKEAKSVSDLRDLFQEVGKYAPSLDCGADNARLTMTQF
jgi:tRNA acetyltransferase TAN1